MYVVTWHYIHNSHHGRDNAVVGYWPTWCFAKSHPNGTLHATETTNPKCKDSNMMNLGSGCCALDSHPRIRFRVHSRASLKLCWGFFWIVLQQSPYLMIWLCVVAIFRWLNYTYCFLMLLKCLNLLYHLSWFSVFFVWNETWQGTPAAFLRTIPPSVFLIERLPGRGWRILYQIHDSIHCQS